MITKLSELLEAAKSYKKKWMVVAYAADSHTIEAAYRAVQVGIVEAVLVGDPEVIEALCQQHGIDPDLFRVVREEGDYECALRAVRMAATGEADILMKGTVSTDKYMRAILSKDYGLLPPKSILTHVAVLEMPTYHKLLLVSDVAIIPDPDLKQKIFITNALIQTSRLLGNEAPRVAIIASTEQMLPSIPSCVDAAIISKMWEREQIRCGVIDGPLAVDVAINPETVKIKKLDSPVAGDADCLVFPNLDASNTFFKTATKLAKASMAGMVYGAKVPCVLTSRGDSEESKLNSIALAVLTTENRN
ncbi:MAG: bifunctional enoyl-CoA hydratase/phosphate acetyltransferase, partial [Rikenellaceae bacterium]|nr:bifunctional enoyl-CoA hydratase/phosphate acetyltransferase [Rikenellaceae bacterium]